MAASLEQANDVITIDDDDDDEDAPSFSQESTMQTGSNTLNCPASSVFHGAMEAGLWQEHAPPCDAMPTSPVLVLIECQARSWFPLHPHPVLLVLFVLLVLLALLVLLVLLVLLGPCSLGRL